MRPAPFKALRPVLVVLAGFAGTTGCTETDQDRDPGGGEGGASGGASGALGERPVSDGPPALRFVGRWSEREDGSREGSWGALAVEGRFRGTAVDLLLEDGGNEFEVQIDDGPLERLSSSGETVYRVAEGLEDAVHSLSVFRRTGGSFGKTVVRGLAFPEGGELLAPFAPRARFLEFVGDSITVGFGNEGNGGTSRETENGFLAYGPSTARLLDADWSVIAHSGQGLFRNLGEEKSAAEVSLHMPDEFLLAHFPSVSAEPWPFDGEEPDAVVVALGTNDFAWKVWNVDPGPAWAPTEDEFVGAYLDFFGAIRERYPNTHIFALGTFLASPTNQFHEANLYTCAAVERANDPKVHCVDPGSEGPEGAWLTSGSDFIGDWTHPTVAGHAKIASRLAETLGDVLGW